MKAVIYSKYGPPDVLQLKDEMRRKTLKNVFLGNLKPCNIMVLAKYCHTGVF